MKKNILRLCCLINILDAGFKHIGTKEDNNAATFDEKYSNHEEVFYADARHVSRCEIQSFELFLIIV